MIEKGDYVRMKRTGEEFEVLAVEKNGLIVILKHGLSVARAAFADVEKVECVQLRKGDWVRTESGLEGRILMMSRQSAFVQTLADGNKSRTVGCLISQLTKIEPPKERPAYDSS